MKIFRCQRGAAAVEFAIIAPLLFTIVFGIVEFSLLFYDKAVITNASREGARFGIVYSLARPDEAQIAAEVATYTSGRLVTFGSSTPVTTAVWSGTTSGDSLTVTVAYDYDFLVFPNFIPGFGNVTTVNAVTVCNSCLISDLSLFASLGKSLLLYDASKVLIVLP